MAESVTSTSTLVSLLEEQSNLIAEAAEVLPHQFTTCTYALGAIRQAIYLCLTCTPPDSLVVPAGICASCSIACHAEHEQVELFPKRAFTCDCPTCALPDAKCTLNAQSTGAAKMPRNSLNQYGQNFKGRFCRCARVYEAAKEQETMIQCVACEDWFHESCLNLRERPPSRAATPVEPSASTLVNSTSSIQPAPAVADGDGHDISKAGVDVPPESLGRENGRAADEDDDEEEDDLPPALLPGSSYETFMCGACVIRTPPVRRYAGTPGVMLIVRTKPGDPGSLFEVIGRDELPSAQQDEVVDIEGEVKVGAKRPRSPTSDGPSDGSKRARTSTPPIPSLTRTKSLCSAPIAALRAQTLLDKVESAQSKPAGNRGVLDSEGDVFFTSGWRERWCRCIDCIPRLERFPWLLEEEDTYEPPEDPDSGLSLEELGMRALERLPRDKAIDGLMAFRDMRDDLMAYLRPFAEQGRVVEERDIGQFFEARREARVARSS